MIKVTLSIGELKVNVNNLHEGLCRLTDKSDKNKVEALCKDIGISCVSDKVLFKNINNALSNLNLKASWIDGEICLMTACDSCDCRVFADNYM
jgi:hypothetical protein